MLTSEHTNFPDQPPRQEQHLGGAVLRLRLAGAALMLAAIVLVLV